MKTIKGKSLAVGLAASLVVGSFLPGATLAAQKEPSQSLYQQLERLGLKQNSVKSSQITKDQDKKFSENQLIVKYKTPLSSSDHHKAGGKLVRRFASLGYDVIEVSSSKKLEAVAAEYAKLGNVTSVTRSAFAKTMGTDVKENMMYHIKALNLSKAQGLAGKNKVKVAVIDTGVDTNHPELKNKVVANKNAMNPLKKGLADSHGTHVAGIIAAEKGNSIGGYGVAPNAEIVSIDVFNRSPFVTDYVIAEGIIEAINQKVHVINMSLGTFYPSPILKDAVQKAIDAGITVVASAGNDGADILNYPASFDGVISVGATNDKNVLADFSTYGPSVDVVAPGEAVYSSVYDYEKGSSFVEMSGTSMSSPVVTGAVALLLSKYPNLTPYQVNYVLTKTAKDMGDKGHDLKYGYGMIDIEKMLSFDPKHIPANPLVNENSLLENAQDLGEFDTIEKSGKLVKLNQADLYKTELTKGEYVQLKLEGTSKYDLKYELLFYKNGEDKPVQKLEVNDTRENQLEGGLFQAPEDGMLVIAVKDSYGKYNETGASTYKLMLERTLELKEDGNTMDSPVVIESLPYSSKLENYYTDEFVPAEESEETESEELEEETMPAEDSETPEELMEVHGDSDFFSFKVPGNVEDEMVAVKINLSEVPGINPSLRLHMINQYEGEEFVEEMDMADMKGYGKGEELIFSAFPGQEYMVEVTNKPFIDPFMMFFFGEVEIDNERSYSSNLPYQLKIDTKALQADEDGIPFEMGMETVEEELAEGNLEEYVARKNEIEQQAFDPFANPYEEMIKMIKEAALPLEEGKAAEGYVQLMGDEDWFTFTPESDSIFEIKMDNSSKYKPVGMNIMKYDEKLKDFRYIYSNEEMSFIDWMPKPKDTFYVGLQKGETYYLRIADPMYRPSFDPYRFTIKTKVKNTADAFENNNDFETAVTITTKGITGNFSGSADMDTYYFKPNKNSVYGISVTPGTLPAKYANVPNDVKAQIDPVLVVIEDTNGNGKMDKEEEGKFTMVDYGFFNDEERTGFKTRKGMGYFILTMDYFNKSSLTPYVLKVDETTMADEDKGSVVKSNIPSKPLVLNQPVKNRFYAFGYLNLTDNKGDADYYKLPISQSKEFTIELEAPTDIDGKITVYDSKGKQVAQSDVYGRGDHEIFSTKLTKGTYYVKVEDATGAASTVPYKIIVK
ncbi:S8 family serine peptidase [Cytobacillus spongiae]|uniref:S8 family serine peptidase n=1 Tax=Cytobacillus spongiae TaxID=2901381 RepID=UPI001F3BA112|nr:S8 family serine peptidase [Cytobacillus spongiae]UII55648.1 S8 family serine peptidase [Cytobacillus spongiae]